MTENNELHIRRVQQALARIPEWRAGTTNALSPDFESWQERTGHSLQVLFGKDHSYTRAFRSLSFWLTRVSIGGGVHWAPQDQERFLADLSLAEHTLTDALEELPSLPPPAPPSVHDNVPRAAGIVVNISNNLSQVTTLTFTQILGEIDGLTLDADSKNRAKGAAQELQKEISGAQRWPVMAKSLELLKVLGKGAYEKVALPLLLELIKKQSGLP